MIFNQDPYYIGHLYGIPIIVDIGHIQLSIGTLFNIGHLSITFWSVGTVNMMAK